MFKKVLRLGMLVVVAVVVAAGAGWSDVPMILNIQARITTGNTPIANSGVSSTAYFYDALTGGNKLAQVDVMGGSAPTDANGVASLNYDLSPVATVLDFTKPYYVSIKIGSNAESAARQPLTAAPYAITAKNVYGGTGYFGGNVGIGTAPTSKPLTVAGDASISGKVGIGTTAPQSTLHVAGNITTPDTVTFQHYNPNYTDGSQIRPYLAKSWNSTLGDYLYLGASGHVSNTAQTAMLLSGHAGTTTNAVQFGLGSDNGASITSPWLTITTAGNVGIGTTAPISMLQVTGTAQFQGGGNRVGLMVDGASNVGIGTAPLYNKLLSVNGDSYFGGNVGIGVTGPSQKLEVNGNVKAAGFIGDGSQLTGLPAASALPSPTTLTNTINFQLHTTAPGIATNTFLKNGWNYGNDQGDYLYLGSVGVLGNTSQSAVILTQYSGILFGKGSDAGGPLSSEFMRINNSGYVGIGTKNPPQYLTVSNGTDGAGLGIGWNRTQGGGETNFYNYGQGGSGGFSFYNYAGNGGSYPAASATPAQLMTIASNGNVGIGAPSPAAKLHVNGSMVLADTGGSATLYGATDAAEHYGYLNLINSLNYGTAWGLKAGGILVSDTYAYASPDKNTLIVKGKIGVGVAAPTAAVDAVGPGGYGVRGNGVYGVWGQSDNANGVGVYGGASSSSGVGVYASGGKYGIFSAAGLNYFAGPVEIKTSTPSQWTSLTVNGLGTAGLGGTIYSMVYNAAEGGVYYNISSRRYKDNIQPLNDDFYKILKAEPKSFTYKKGGYSSIGYIAEDFDAAGLKNLVTYDKEGRPDAIQYEKISLYMLEVMKDQQAQIKELKAENEALKSKIEAIEKKLEK